MKHVKVSTEEAVRVYLLLEEMNRFLHQPGNYKSQPAVVDWLRSGGVYPELRDLLYRKVTKWLPKQALLRIEQGATDAPFPSSSVARNRLVKALLKPAEPMKGKLGLARKRRR